MLGYLVYRCSTRAISAPATGVARAARHAAARAVAVMMCVGYLANELMPEATSNDLM